MSPVGCVTYVSGRSHALVTNPVVRPDLYSLPNRPDSGELEKLWEASNMDRKANPYDVLMLCDHYRRQSIPIFYLSWEKEGFDFKTGPKGQIKAILDSLIAEANRRAELPRNELHRGH